MTGDDLLTTASGSMTTLDTWWTLGSLQESVTNIQIVDGRLSYTLREPLHPDFKFVVETNEDELIELLQDASERVIH
jgi:hypothetical protein